MGHISLVDQLVLKIDKILKGLVPAQDFSSPSKSSIRLLHITPPQQQQSIRLMRINHSGEVCAQALYYGQAWVARDKNLAYKLKEAAEEEKLHLKLCTSRLQELKGRISYFTPLWAIGSFTIGALAGLCGDKISLGFLAETEHQVVRHLDKHLELLPKTDTRSRNILEKMREDELRHATQAINQGGVALPSPIRFLMTLTSKVMTMTARYI